MLHNGNIRRKCRKWKASTQNSPRQTLTSSPLCDPWALSRVLTKLLLMRFWGEATAPQEGEGFHHQKKQGVLCYRIHPQPTQNNTTQLITTDPTVSCSKKYFWGTPFWFPEGKSLADQAMLSQAPCLSFTPGSSAYRRGQIPRSALSVCQSGLLCLCEKLAVCEDRKVWESIWLLIHTPLVRKANELVPN